MGGIFSKGVREPSDRDLITCSWGRSVYEKSMIQKIDSQYDPPHDTRHGKRHGHADIVRGYFGELRKIFFVEDYAPLFSEENLFLVEMFDETLNIWHIHGL